MYYHVDSRDSDRDSFNTYDGVAGRQRCRIRPSSFLPPPTHPPRLAVSLSPRIPLAACVKSATPSVHLHIDEAACMFSIYSKFLSIDLKN
jgi:hypothetical protein